MMNSIHMMKPIPHDQLHPHQLERHVMEASDANEVYIQTFNIRMRPIPRPHLR